MKGKMSKREYTSARKRNRIRGGDRSKRKEGEYRRIKNTAGRASRRVVFKKGGSRLHTSRK
jgi:hypothetical protein